MCVFYPNFIPTVFKTNKEMSITAKARGKVVNDLDLEKCRSSHLI